MPSAERPRTHDLPHVVRLRGAASPARVVRRTVAVGVLAATLGVPAAHADVVRLTTVRSNDAPSTASVAVLPLDGPAAAPVPVTGLPDALAALERSPDGGRVAFAGADALTERPVPRAGVFGVRGGAVTPLVGPNGEALAGGARDSGRAPELRTPWISWAPTGASFALHGFDVAADPWFAPPTTRRCDAVTGRCGPVRREEAVALPGGGTVRVGSALVAPTDDARNLDPDFSGGDDLARRVRARLHRRYAVRVRVTGRAGVASAWTTTGTLRRGAPALDRTYPSRTAVLVRLSTVRYDAGEGGYTSLTSRTGPAVIVRGDGTLRRIRALPYDVVGTLPDGRWILAGGAQRPFPRPATGEPLRTLDAEGRVRVLRAGRRPITPIWVANALGLPDSRSTQSSVLRAGADPATGRLVLAMEVSTSRLVGSLADELVAVVPLDGATPPRAPFGVASADAWEQTTTDLVG